MEKFPLEKKSEGFESHEVIILGGMRLFFPFDPQRVCEKEMIHTTWLKKNENH